MHSDLVDIELRPLALNGHQLVLLSIQALLLLLQRGVHCQLVRCLFRHSLEECRRHQFRRDARRWLVEILIELFSL